jgi:hypothetical protein
MVRSIVLALAVWLVGAVDVAPAGPRGGTVGRRDFFPGADPRPPRAVPFGRRGATSGNTATARPARPPRPRPRPDPAPGASTLPPVMPLE